VDFRHASLELVEGALSSSGGLELSAASQAASVPVEFRFFVGGAHRQRFKVGGASRLPVEAFSVLAFPAGRRGGFAGDAAVSGADGLFIGCAGGEGRERSFASGVLGVSALGNRDSASHATLIVAGGLNTSSAFGGQSAGRRLSGGLGKFAAGAAGSEVEFGSFINSANGKRGPRTGSHLFRTASHRRGSGVFWDGSLRFAEVSVAKILAALGVSGVGGSFGAMFFGGNSWAQFCFICDSDVTPGFQVVGSGIEQVDGSESGGGCFLLVFGNNNVHCAVGIGFHHEAFS